MTLDHVSSRAAGSIAVGERPSPGAGFLQAGAAPPAAA